MFNLDIIEADWKANCTCLSDEEILEIYKQEGVTSDIYLRELDELRKSLPKVSGEERLLAAVFNHKDDLERIWKMDQENDEKLNAKRRAKKRLSPDSQKRVVEGTMDVVFHATRSWYKTFEGKVPMEEIYYVCVRALLKATKYCLHYSTKACFRSYVYRSIHRAIVDFMAQREHISYRNALYIIEKLYMFYGVNPDYKDHFEYECYHAMKVESPTTINKRIKGFSHEVDYVGIANSSLFMREYEEALDKMPQTWALVMRLSYHQACGHNRLTVEEISEILGKPIETIEEIKKKAIKELRKNKRLNMYRWP